MLNYLQFCYYKVNKILEAANAAKSQELLTPNDENAKKNVQYYMGKVLETGHKDFQGIVLINVFVSIIYYMDHINGNASFRWSFGPHSACGSIDLTTIFTTHPSLLSLSILILTLQCKHVSYVNAH